MSQYFLSEDQPEELVHGMQLFHELYDEEAVQRVLHDENQEQEMFNVQAVKAAFGAHYTHYGPAVEGALFGGFVSMLTHDALIGVQDRHHENWGVIVHRDVSGSPPRFAPLYDSARGLFCNRTDAELTKAFGGAQGHRNLDSYVARARPLVGFSGLKPLGRRYITHDQLLAAVFWAYPDQRNRIAAILEGYDWRLVRDELRRGLAGHCSPQRQALILVCLRRRLRALWRAINAGPTRADIIG